MRVDEVEALLERYHVLDARVRSDEPVSRRRRRVNPEVLEIRAAVVRADIDRALTMLRQHDEQLWCVIHLVHVIPYPDPTHPDYHRDRHWFVQNEARLRHSLTTRRQLAALDLGCSYGTVYSRCRTAYRLLASMLS
ncbi:MAG: hypothetical protein RMJ05_03840 [Thermomicrobium sp.]|nr:hypothetical protein [Thermomicrobium sp.]MDW8005828.1 hypothetical protein [Thermomicrobium sp.]